MFRWVLLQFSFLGTASKLIFHGAGITRHHTVSTITLLHIMIVYINNIIQQTQAKRNRGIRTELEMQGYKDTNIRNVKQRTSKQPIQLHLIKIECNHNIKLLQYKKSIALQSCFWITNCFFFLMEKSPYVAIAMIHKKYCFGLFKCIKWDHASYQCHCKESSNSVKCILSISAIYKKLQKIK